MMTPINNSTDAFVALGRFCLDLASKDFSWSSYSLASLVKLRDTCAEAQQLSGEKALVEIGMLLEISISALEPEKDQVVAEMGQTNSAPSFLNRAFFCHAVMRYMLMGQSSFQPYTVTELFFLYETAMESSEYPTTTITARECLHEFMRHVREEMARRPPVEGFVPEMFTTKPKEGQKGFFTDAIRASLPDVKIGLDDTTKDFVNEITSKLTELVETTPLMQGKHTVGIDFGSIDFPSLSNGGFSKLLLPTFLVLGGAAAAYYLHRNPIKYGWVQKILSAIGALISLMGVSMAGMEIYNQLHSGIVKAAEKDRSLYDPDEDAYLGGRSRADTVEYADVPKKDEYVKEIGFEFIELIAVPILAWLHFGTMDRKPSPSFVKDFVHRMKDTKDISDTIRFSVDFLMKYVHHAIRFMSDWAGMPEWEAQVHPYPNIAAIDIQVREITRGLRTRTIEPTKTTAQTLSRLEEDLFRTLSLLKPGSNEFIAAKGIEAAIRDLIDKHKHVWKKNDIRRRPFNITLVGMAGVGKSVLLQLLAMDITPQLLDGRELYDHLQDPEGDVYYVNAEANFLDGFRHQKCVVLDDVGLLKDPGTSVADASLLMAIRIDNDAPWTPDQASLGDKSAGYTMNNVLTLVSSNMLKFNSITHPSFTHPEAMRRRWNSYFVTIKKEYSKGEEENILNRRINPLACPDNEEHAGELATSVWEFHPWNMETGTRDMSRNVLEYEDFVALSVREANAMGEFSDRYKHTRIARKTRVHQKVLEEKGLRMEDLLDERRVAIARARRANAAGAIEDEAKDGYASEMGKEPKGDDPVADVKDPSVVMRIKLYIEEKFADCKVAVEDIVSKPLRAGCNMLHDIDVAMKPHLEAAYKQADSCLEIVKETVRKNPFLTALAAGALVLTVGAFFLPVEEQFLSHSGHTKAQKDKKKPSKRERTLARSLKARQAHYDATGAWPVSPEMGDHEDNILNLICNNMFEFSICSDGRPVKSGFAVGVAGTTIVLPLHYLSDLAVHVEENPSVAVTVSLRSLKSGSEPMIFTKEALWDCCVNLEHNETLPDDECQEDIVFLNLPNVMHRVRDIRTHMLSDTDVLTMAAKGEAKLMRIKRTIVGLDRKIDSVEYKRDKLPKYWDHDMCVTNAFSYAAHTSAGDCGSPLFIKLGSDWKLAGFHVAGTRNKGSDAKGISCMLSRWLVNPYVSNVGPNGIPLPAALEPKEMPVIMWDHQLGGVPVAGIKRAYQNTSSNIVPGFLAHIGPPSEKLPARMRPFTMEDGTYVDPMEKARSGYSPVTHVLGEPMRHVMQALFVHKTKVCGTVEGVMSIHDACFGAGSMRALTPGTSAGYPEKKIMPSGWKGKTWFLGKDGIGSEAPGYPTLVDMVEEARTNMLKGEPHLFLFEDNLKDEVVSKAKYAAGKTRLFSTGPLRLQVLFRMYFGKALDVIRDKKNIMHNFCTVGINPYTDWPALHKYLSTYPKALEMDHDSFDKRETSEILFLAFELLGKMYPTATAEDRTMRRLIAEAIVMSYHINGDKLFRWNGSNPSGNSGTIDLNDIVNQMLILFTCLVWYLKRHGLTVHDCVWAEVDWEEIITEIRLVTMGDDVLMTVGPLFEGITTKFFAETLAELGYKITNADKSDPYLNPQPPKSLEECTFIKRSFKRVNGVIRAPLELASIRKSYQWMDKSLNMEQYKEIVQMALYEYALHGKEVFEREAEPVILAMAAPPISVILEDTTFSVCLHRTGSLFGFHN